MAAKFARPILQNTAASDDDRKVVITHLRGNFVAHSLASTGVAFAILFAVVGVSFVYVSANPVTVQSNPQAKQQPWTGIAGINLTPAIAQATGTSEQSGFLVTAVTPNSPADKAGMKGGDREVTVEGKTLAVGGDIIIEVDGRPATSFAEIQQVFQQKHIGDTMRFTVVRGSVTMQIPVTIEEKPPTSVQP
ncbi:MAG: PDZ domain-containing protein [Nitrososphaera sp.]